MVGRPRQPSKPAAAADHGLTAPANANPATPSLTPYQRMRELLATRASTSGARVITTVEGKLSVYYSSARIAGFSNRLSLCSTTYLQELQSYLKANPKPEGITIRMKLLWVSNHQHKQWKFARLHFIDAGSSEPLEELLEVR
jgi:hypothetical protein